MSSLAPQTVLGRVAPDALVESRLLLHWAAQIPGSLGFTCLPQETDWGHISLAFQASEMLMSRPTPGVDPIRFGLHLSSLALVALDLDNELVGQLVLEGQTIEDAYAWFRSMLDQHSICAGKTIQRPAHEMPNHPVGEGEAFTMQEAGFGELARWYQVAHHALAGWQHHHSQASPVRCWPHHFDMAFLITLDPDKDPEEGRSVGVGFSPGDETYQQPYLYVTPWPYPLAEDVPALISGAWHVEGWIGATLQAADIVAHETAEGQHHVMDTFLGQAIEACLSLIEK